MKDGTVFVVVRTYSHTDKRQLWSVESKRFIEKSQAENWSNFLQKEWNESNTRVSEFFVVEIEV
jgi:hypothetical protein